MKTIVFDIWGCLGQVPAVLSPDFHVLTEVQEDSTVRVYGSVVGKEPEDTFWHFYSLLSVTGTCSMLVVEHKPTGLYARTSPLLFGVHDVPARFRTTAVAH